MKGIDHNVVNVSTYCASHYQTNKRYFACLSLHARFADPAALVSQALLQAPFSSSLSSYVVLVYVASALQLVAVALNNPPLVCHKYIHHLRFCWCSGR